jgi:hypothetical protein
VLQRLLVHGVGGRDAAAYFDRTYHPAVVIHEAPSLPYGGDYVGLDGAVEHARAFLATWGDRQRPEHHGLAARWWAGPTEAACRWELRAAEGRATHRFLAMSHYRFRDGLIVESRMFHFDLPALLDFLSRTADRR